MKYLLILVFIIGGCNNDFKNDKTPESATDMDLYLRKIDSCEYVVYLGTGIVHSGNCHNPKHLK